MFISKKRKAKRRYHIQPRYDLQRKRLGIPSDVSPELLRYRREQEAAAIKAKAPHIPRIVQRQLRLEAKAAEKLRMAEARKSIAARLGMAAA